MVRGTATKAPAKAPPKPTPATQGTKGRKRQRDPSPVVESSEEEAVDDEDEDEESGEESGEEIVEVVPPKRKRQKTARAIEAEAAAAAKAQATKANPKKSGKKKKSATPLQVAFTAEGDVVSNTCHMVNLPLTNVQDLGHATAIDDAVATREVADDVELFFGPRVNHVFVAGAGPEVGRFCLTCQ